MGTPAPSFSHAKYRKVRTTDRGLSSASATAPVLRHLHSEKPPWAGGVVELAVLGSRKSPSTGGTLTAIDWRCPQHGLVEPLEPDPDGYWRCPELSPFNDAASTSRCGLILIAQRAQHPELSDDSDYIVIRDTDGPLDGKVMNRASWLGGELAVTDASGRILSMAATGELESLEDGTVVEVFRPAS